MNKEELIIKSLDLLFPDAKPELVFQNNFELLIAVVLSAQTTDKAVNQVTKVLFAKYTTPKELANAEVKDVESILNKIGLYRNKTKNIINIARIINDEYDGIVPNKREELESLPGVGRKTTNVVLSVAFDIPAFAVDTHVERISKRLSIADESDNVLKVEKKLNRMFPKNKWLKLHHQLIFFGRYHCTARKPKCSKCPLFDICIYDKKNENDK